MTTLRERIVENMEAILGLIGNANCGDDFRPEIIASVQRIAELETMPPSKARRAFDQVAKDVRRLELSLKKLPPMARDLIRVEGHKMARWNFAKEAMSSTKADRKMLAAKVALDLMLSHGGKAPTLTKDGPYVRLTSLLYFTATGKRNRLARNCKQRFDDFKASGFDFYSLRPGPRGSRPSAWLWEFMRTQTPNGDQKRSTPWPTLEEVVDEALGRSK